MKNAIRLLVLTLGVVFGTSCAGESGESSTKEDEDKDRVEKTTINMITGFHSFDGQAMEAIVSEYNQANPNTTIVLTQGSTGYYDAAAAAVQGGTPPQIIICHRSKLPYFKEYLTDLNGSPAGDLVARAGITADDFLTGKWAEGSDGGNQYLVPLDMHVYGTWYNKEIFEKTNAHAGSDLCTASAISTGAGFAACADGIVAAREAGELDADVQAATLLGSNPPRYVRRSWEILVWQQGAEDLDFENDQANIDTLEGKQALAYLISMATAVGTDVTYSHGGTEYTEPGKGWTRLATQAEVDLGAADEVGNIVLGNTMFNEGKLGIDIVGNWLFSGAEAALANGGTDRLYGGTIIPQFFDTRVTWGDSHNMAIPQQPDNADAGLYEATMDAIDWLSRNSATWGKVAGHVPTRKDANESSVLRESVPWEVYMQDFVAQAPYVHFEYRDERIPRLQAAMDVCFGQAYLGEVGIDEALQIAQARADHAFANPLYEADTASCAIDF